MKSKFWMVAVAMMALILGGVAMLSYAQESATSAPQRVWQGRHARMAYMARELNLTRRAEGPDQGDIPVQQTDRFAADAADGHQQEGHAGGDGQR